MFSSAFRQITFLQTDPMQIPEGILKNWEITDWLSLKKTHAIFRAVHKQTEEVKIFQIISRTSFSKSVWASLSCIHSDYLLLPTKQKSIKNAYLLSYNPATPLDSIIRKDGMNVKMLLQLLLDISKALQKLHQADILHMDVSPRNIYLSEHGNFSLGDFSESISSKTRLISVQPRSTPGYAPPEYNEGNPVKSSDQYSLAMLAYVLFNDGLLPTELHSLPEPAIVRSDPKIGQEIFSALKKALSTDPTLRYENLSVFQEVIQSILSHVLDTCTYCLHITDKSHPFFQLSTEQKFASSLPKQRGKFLIVPAFLLFLIFLLFPGIHLSNKTKQQRNSSAEETSVKTDQKLPEEKSLAEINLAETDGALLSETNSINIATDFSEELDLAGRNLSSLMEVMSECDNPSLFQKIYGENNHLKGVEELQIFPSLQELYLSNNQIQDTDSFRELTNLSILILSDNLCTDLNGLSDLEELSFLDLSGNRDLSDISPLENCGKLNTLVLSDTAVTEISIKQLQAKLPECEILY